MAKTEIRNLRQQEGLQAIIDNNDVGTAMCVVSWGKSFLMYNWLYSLLERGKIQLGETIWLFSVTTEQGLNLLGESEVYFKVKGKNPKEDFNLVNHCYAGMPVNKFPLPKVACYDEADACLASSFSKNISLEIPCRLGMTGTNTANANVFTTKLSEELVGEVRQSDTATKEGKITDFINKGQLLEILCPVVYEYTREDGLRDGIVAPMETTIINHTLDTQDKSIQIWKSKPDYLGSEYDYYNSRQGLVKSWKTNRFSKARMAKECCSFLWNLPSKRHVIKRLIDSLKGQTILFGWNLPLLCMITNNVVQSKSTYNFTIDNVFYTTKKVKGATKYFKKHMLEYKAKEIKVDVYKEAKRLWLDTIYMDNLLEKFKAKEINLIASSKAIGRGVSPGTVNNIILASYPSKEANIEQWIGRSRFEEGKITNVYIIRTLATYEQVWVDKFTQIYDDKGVVVRELDLNVVKSISSISI